MIILSELEVYEKFCELFPCFVDDISDHSFVNTGSIILHRKSRQPWPVLIFTYTSPDDWELMSMRR